MSETSISDCLPSETSILSETANAHRGSQDLPEELRTAHRELRTLCEILDTRPSIHCDARELYESIHKSEEFVSEHRETLIAGCLFIAYGYVDTDCIYQGPLGRKSAYRERSTLAPATEDDSMRVFAALEKFILSATGRNRVKSIQDVASSRYPERSAAISESKNTLGVEPVVNDSVKSLLAIYRRIEAFCECLPAPSRVLRHVTAQVMALYEDVHLAGGFQRDEQEAVVAGCFYIAFRQLGAPRTFREVWIVTKVPIEEVEAVVKDLEKFFAEEHTFGQDIKEEAGDPHNDPGTISSSHRTSLVSKTKEEPVYAQSTLPMSTAVKPTILPPTTLVEPRDSFTATISP